MVIFDGSQNQNSIYQTAAYCHSSAHCVLHAYSGKTYLMEYAFDADFAIVKAWKGDKHGNLIFKDTARNFNPMMAMAGKVTIAEVEELVEAGELNPNDIHVPGVYVHRIVQGSDYEKRIEQRTVRKKGE